MISARSRTPAVRRVCSTLNACPFAGGGAVADADDQPLVLTGVEPIYHVAQRFGGLGGMRGSADRPGMSLRAEAGCGGEVQLGAGGIDQVVVGECGALALSRRLGIGELYRWCVLLTGALGTDDGGIALMELDPFALVDRFEGYQHLLGRHFAHPDPDVGGNPVPVRFGGDHGNLVPRREHPPKMQCGSVSGDSGAEDDDSGHGGLPVSRGRKCRGESAAKIYPIGYLSNGSQVRSVRVSQLPEWAVTV